MSKIPTPHISAPEGAFAETVLMPGDPLRARYIAEEYLEDAKLVTSVRNTLGYTGYFHGKKVSVMASGMGSPSIGIYSYELFNFYNVSNIIRIGSAGGISSRLELYDLIIAMSAYTDRGYVDSFGFDGHVAPCCSYELLSRAIDKSPEFSNRVFFGPVYTSDLFYDETGKIGILSKFGVLAVEMETAALYMNAAKAGKNALSICTISDNLVTGEALSSEERQCGFRKMIELGLSIA